MRDNSRQSFLGKDLDNVLATATVGLIGLNGGGSHYVQQISNVGFKRYVLSDPQPLDHSNLNRNVLASINAAERGISKVDLAAERILSLVPDAEIIRVKEKWQVGADRGDFDQCSVIIGCVDTLLERDQIERFARSRGVPYLDIGMNVKQNAKGKFDVYGQAIMTFPGGPCLRCLGFITDEGLAQEAALYGDAGVRPQVVWPNGTLASLGMGFLMSYFFDWSSETPPYWYRLYDGNTMEVSKNEYVEHLLKNKKSSCSHF